jgi:hypothetical protein
MTKDTHYHWWIKVKFLKILNVYSLSNPQPYDTKNSALLKCIHGFDCL